MSSTSRRSTWFRSAPAANRCSWRWAARRRRRPSTTRCSTTFRRRASAASPSSTRRLVDQRILAVYFGEDGRVDQHRQLRHAGRQGVRLHLAHHADRRQGPQLPGQLLPAPARSRPTSSARSGSIGSGTVERAARYRHSVAGSVRRLDHPNKNPPDRSRGFLF